MVMGLQRNQNDFALSCAVTIPRKFVTVHIFAAILVVSLMISGYYFRIEASMDRNISPHRMFALIGIQQTNTTTTFNKTAKLEVGFSEPTVAQSTEFPTTSIPSKGTMQGSQTPTQQDPKPKLPLESGRQTLLEKREKQHWRHKREPHDQLQRHLPRQRQHKREPRRQPELQPTPEVDNRTAPPRISSTEKYHPMCDRPCRAYIPPSHSGQHNQATKDHMDSCHSAILKAVRDYESFHSETHKRWLQLCSANTTGTTNATDITTLDPFCQSVKFLGFGCPPGMDCAGFGDRFRVLSSLYYLSIVSKRILLFRSDKNWEIRDYLQPNKINWDYRDWPNLPYKLQQRIQNFKSKNVKEGYEPYREDEYYGCMRRPKKPLQLKCLSVVLTSKYVSGGPRFFEDPFNAIAPGACGPLIHNMSSLFERQSIRAGAISSIFKMSEIVQNRVAEMKKHVGDPKNCIMIHSRTNELENGGEKPNGRPDNVDGVQQERFLLAEKLNKKYNKTFKWVLVADDEEVKKQEKALYPDLVTFDTTPVHTNFKGEKLDYKFEGSALDNLRDTWSEFYMLGYCDILIRGVSGFANGAEWFHGVEKVRDREVYEFVEGR